MSTKRVGYDRSFASPADYEDGFIESDAARVAREEAIRANVARKNERETALSSDEVAFILSATGTKEPTSVEETKADLRERISTDILIDDSKHNLEDSYEIMRPSFAQSWAHTSLSRPTGAPGTGKNIRIPDDDIYWTMDGITRDKHLMLAKEAGFFDDCDFLEHTMELANMYGMEALEESVQAFWQNVSRPDALMEYADSTGFTKNQEFVTNATHEVNTGRFLRIAYYKDGKPDRTDGQYSNPYDKSAQPYATPEYITVYESVPRGDHHEFWRVGPESKDTFSAMIVGRDNYSVIKVLSDKEASLYEGRRKEFADHYKSNYDKNVAAEVTTEKSDFDVTD